MAKDEALEARLAQIRKDRGHYASYSARIQYVNGPFQVITVEDDESGTVTELCQNHISELNDKQQAPIIVLEDDGTPALGRDCDVCKEAREKAARKKTKEELIGLLGNREWNDFCRGDVATQPFEDATGLHYYPGENMSIGVYKRIPENFHASIDLRELLSYLVQQGVNKTETIGQDGYFSMSDVKGQIDEAKMMSELFSQAAKDFDGLHNHLRAVHG